MEKNQKKPSGLLNNRNQGDRFKLDLLSPSADLEQYVEHYWIVKWDLRGQDPYVSENLPHPSVHLTVEPDRTVITGVVKQKFTRTLTGHGVVFGIKFYPGAFYPFAQEAVNRFTGRIVPAEHVFGADAAALADEIRSLAAEDEAGMAARAECFLRMRLPDRDHNVELIRAVIERIRNDRSIISVETAAAEFHLTVRMLQRLFSKYVGVSPKWVIRRYRLLEVADQLAEGPPASWPRLAAELGYFDQSHFIKDFKSIVGLSPDEYARRNWNGRHTDTDPDADADQG